MIVISDMPPLGLRQNFRAMMFRFQAARNLIARLPDDTMRSLDCAINEGEKALGDSLNAIQDPSFGKNECRISRQTSGRSVCIIR